MTATPRKEFPGKRGGAFGTVEPIFDDVWWAWGTTQFFPGATFPRNMALAREGGGLVAIHPVMMPDAEQARIDALGPVEHVLRLGDFHGMDDALYQSRYGAKLWWPRGATPREGASPDVETIAGGETPFSDATLHAFENAAAPETVLHLRRHGGILFACDSLQSWERIPKGCSFIGSLLAKAMGFRGRACIGPGWRKQCEPKEGPGFGPKLRELLDLDFRHIVGGHGPPIIDTAKDDLKKAIDAAYPV
jgi:hypothetical protein